MENDISLITVLALASLAPFLIACGTCYIKFSIVFVMIRNAIGLQQIPSNMTLNGIAFVMAAFVMMPVMKDSYDYYQKNNPGLGSSDEIEQFVGEGFSGYRDYLIRYTDPDLAAFFERAQHAQLRGEDADEQNSTADEDAREPSMLSLLPAYALSEIKDAFKIGFYIYLPFVVVDMLISSILLTLGMMMMSPVTISVPIKLLLFVMLDGWTLVSQGLIGQYLSVSG